MQLRFTLVFLFVSLFIQLSAQPPAVYLRTQQEVDDFSVSVNGEPHLAYSLYIQSDATQSIKNLDGLNFLESIQYHLIITGNDSLANLDGLSNLTEVGILLSIIDNKRLNSIDGLQNINLVNEARVVRIYDNPVLTSCSMEWLCDYLHCYETNFILNNGPGCNTALDVLTECGWDADTTQQQTIVTDGFEEWELAGDSIIPAGWLGDVNTWPLGLTIQREPALTEGAYALGLHTVTNWIEGPLGTSIRLPLPDTTTSSFSISFDYQCIGDRGYCSMTASSWPIDRTWTTDAKADSTTIHSVFIPRVDFCTDAPFTFVSFRADPEFSPNQTYGRPSFIIDNLKIHRLNEVPVAVADETTVLNSINVFPNPAHAVIYLDSVSPGSMVEVYDMLGSIMMRQAYFNGLSVADLSAGMYVLHVYDKNKQRHSLKFTKQ